MSPARQEAQQGAGQMSELRAELIACLAWRALCQALAGTERRRPHQAGTWLVQRYVDQIMAGNGTRDI